MRVQPWNVTTKSWIDAPSMKQNFQQAIAHAPAHKELSFPEAEFERHLTCLRNAVSEASLDLVFPASP